jgi:hypothetical protein
MSRNVKPNHRISDQNSDDSCSKLDTLIQQYFVPIEGFQLLEQRSEFVVFKLKVEPLSSSLNHGNPTSNGVWYVYRRFTDFRRLYDKLKQTRPDLEFQFVTPKWRENSFNQSFLERRQANLQLFLNQLMSDRKLLLNSEVRKFLCINRKDELNELNTNCDVQSDLSTVCGRCCTLQSLLVDKERELQSLRNQLKQLEQHK